MASPPKAAVAGATAGLIVALAAFASSSSAAAAFKFDVTEILDEFPEFSVFNGLLSQTTLADEINRRQTVTVLVVDDSAAGAITSLPADTRRKVLAVQVLLDYYDPVKLYGVKAKTALLSTLFQAATGGGGAASTGRMGFVNYTENADGQMMFGSAEPGAPISSDLVKVVASRPYNLSVMQLSAPIVPPSIASSSGEGNNGDEPPSSPAPAKNAVSSEASSQASGTVTPTSLSDYDDDPIIAPASTVDTPSLAAEGPANVDTPTTSPRNETNAKAEAVADGTTTTSSAGSRVMVGARVGLTATGLLLTLISV